MAADSPRGTGSTPAQLAPRLLAALEWVKVASACRSGVEADRQIEAKSTAEFTHRLSRSIYEVLHVGWPTPPACRPALSPGYWVADGTRALAAGDRIVRLHVHLTGPAAAVAAWAAILTMLEERAVAVRAKVTSIPALLPRRDALVVDVGDRDLAAVSALAARSAGLPLLNWLTLTPTMLDQQLRPPQ